MLASDSSPRWTDDDDTIDLGFVLFFLLAKLLLSEKEEFEEQVRLLASDEENILTIEECMCVDIISIYQRVVRSFVLSYLVSLSRLSCFIARRLTVR